MPIVGEIPRTTALPTKATPANMSLRDVRGAVLVTTEKVLKSLSKSTDSILKQKRWELSWAEFRQGWLSEQTQVSMSDLHGAVLSPRFCLAEHHWVQEPKFRLIGDLAKSNLDKTVQMSGT